MKPWSSKRLGRPLSTGAVLQPLLSSALMGLMMGVMLRAWGLAEELLRLLSVGFGWLLFFPFYWNKQLHWSFPLFWGVPQWVMLMSGSRFFSSINMENFPAAFLLVPLHFQGKECALRNFCQELYTPRTGCTVYLKPWKWKEKLVMWYVIYFF